MTKSLKVRRPAKEESPVPVVVAASTEVTVVGVGLDAAGWMGLVCSSRLARWREFGAVVVTAG